MVQTILQGDQCSLAGIAKETCYHCYARSHDEKKGSCASHPQKTYQIYR